MDSMQQDLISVVVPVYNVEKWIDRCVQSIIEQSYKNLEIILVNDGSTDASSNKCDSYALKDKRIKVIHKENGGLSDARNVGIDIAKGKYITFIDSDDYVALVYIEELYNFIQKDGADISICDIENIYNDLREEFVNKEECRYEQWDSINALRHMLLQYDITCNAWGKLYKTELFRKIRYPKGKLYEDLGTTYKIFTLAKKIVFFDKKLYAYYQRYNSIQNSKFDVRKFDEIQMVNELKRDVDIKYPELQIATLNRKISSYFHVLFSIDDKKKYKKDIEKLEQVIKKYRKILIFSKESNKKVRLGCICTYMGFGVAEKIYTLVGVRGKINM